MSFVMLRWIHSFKDRSRSFWYREWKTKYIGIFSFIKKSVLGAHVCKTHRTVICISLFFCYHKKGWPGCFIGHKTQFVENSDLQFLESSKNLRPLYKQKSASHHGKLIKAQNLQKLMETALALVKKRTSVNGLEH